MGLLDSINLDALQSPQGRLAMGLLAAAGPSAVPQSFGQRLFGAMSQHRAEQMAEEERKQRAAMQALQAQLIGAQIGETQAQQEERKARAADIARRADAMRSLQDVLGGSAAPTQYGVGGGGMSLGGVSEPMRPKAGGLAGATPEQIAFLKAQGIDVSKEWELAKFGKEMQPGYRRNADGTVSYFGDPTKGVAFENGQVSLMPGAAETQAGLTRATQTAQEEAKAGLDLVQGVDASGKPGYIGTRLSVAQGLRTPQQAPRSLQDVMRAEGDTFATYDIGGKRGSINLGGQGGGFLATGQSPREKRADEAVALGNQSFMKESYTPVLSAGSDAQRTLASVQTARAALKALGGTGWTTPAVAAGAAVLGSLGVPQADKLASNAQIFQSAAMERLWTTLNAAKGMQTEGDADRASKTFASLKNTTRANEFILDLAQAQAERDAMRASYFRDALPLAQQDGDLQKIEREWARIAPSVFSLPSMRKWSQQ